MKRLTFFVGSLILLLLLLAGCAGENTYAVDFDANGDFAVVVFNGDAATVKDGQGLTPNSLNNPFTGAPGAKLTIVVKAIGNFSGNVHLATSQATGGIVVTQPVPADQSLPQGGFKASEFTYSFAVPAPSKLAPGSRSVLVTGTSGSKTHTYKVIFTDNGDFTVTVFNGDAATIGDGTGHTPNSVSNQFAGLPGSKLTVVIKPINGFAGTVHLVGGQETGGVTVTQPVPADLNVSLGVSKSAEFTYSLQSPGRPQRGALGALQGRTAVITATSGTLTHTYTVFFLDNGDFTITVYNGDAATIGDGTGFTPNSITNQFDRAPGELMTVVIKTVGSYKGTVHLSAGQETGGILLSQPLPGDLFLVAGESKDSEFTWQFQDSRPKRGARGAFQGPSGVITATDGVHTHTYTAFVNFE